MKFDWLAFIAFTLVLLGAAVAGTIFRLPLWQTLLLAAVVIGVVGVAVDRSRKR